MEGIRRQLMVSEVRKVVVQCEVLFDNAGTQRNGRKRCVQTNRMIRVPNSDARQLGEKPNRKKICLVIRNGIAAYAVQDCQLAFNLVFDPLFFYKRNSAGHLPKVTCT